MKKTNRYLFVLFLSFIIFAPIKSNAGNIWGMNAKLGPDNFSLIISLDKQDFLEGENIWVNVFIKNESNSYDSLPFISNQLLSEKIKIKNNKFKELPYHGVTADHFDLSYVIFEPNEEKSFEFEIQWCYGVSHIENSSTYSDYFPEDNYILYLEYDKIFNKLKTNLRSNEISFVVTKPIGIEEEAFNQLIKIYQIPVGNTKPTLKKIIDSYIDFMNQFPKSVYVERVMDFSGSARQVSNYKYDNTFINDVMSFLDNFPNSRLSYTVLFEAITIMKNIKNKNEIQNVLSETETKYPNTRTQYAIKKLISEIDTISKYNY